MGWHYDNDGLIFLPRDLDGNIIKTGYHKAKGGDGGASKRAASDEAEKASARASVNRLFGIGQDVPALVAPKLEDFLMNTALQEPGRGTGFLGNSIRGTGFLGQFGRNNSNNPAQYDTKAFNAAKLKYDTNVKNYKTTSATKLAREAQYKDTADSIYQYNMKDLNQTAAREGRNLKFQLATQGLSGGSEDVNQNSRFQQLFDSGKLQARNKGDSAASQLAAADEQTRLGLINSINAGTDATSAIAGANAALTNNINTARSDGLGTTLGNVFSDGSLLSAATSASSINPFAALFGAKNNSISPSNSSSKFSGTVLR